jgi:hypothetical protein
VRIPSTFVQTRAGHAHFWDRAAQHGITRGQFLTRAAVATGAAAALGTAWPKAAGAKPLHVPPLPIPGGFHPADFGAPVPPFPSIIHVLAPNYGSAPDDDPITVYNFKGEVGYSIIDGSGVGTDTETGEQTHYTTNTDMRFMQGKYVAADGRVRTGHFAFV